MGETLAKSAPTTERETVWILDTSAVMSGDWSPRAPHCLAPPGVAAEFSPGGRTYAAWQRLQAAGLRVQTASDGAVEEVREHAKRLGETRLSATDLEVAALARTQSRSAPSVVVVTDDYALQNLLEHMGLSWQGSRERGIQTLRVYRLRCAGCGRWYDADADHEEGGECPVCGSSLRRRRTKS